MQKGQKSTVRKIRARQLDAARGTVKTSERLREPMGHAYERQTSSRSRTG